MKRLLIVLAAGVFAAAAGTPALANPAWKRYLFPTLVRQPIPGINGSLWTSEAWLSYSGEEKAFFAPVLTLCQFQCSYPVAVEGPLPPIQMVPDPLHDTALLVHVSSSEAPHFSFELRIRDVSREHDSAGTEIPVISEDAMSALPRRLLNIPLRARFRNTLRIYALPEVAEPEVEVRYLMMPERGQLEARVLRSDRVVMRRRPATGSEMNLGIQGFYPSIAEVGHFHSFPEMAGHDEIWIEVVPVTPGLRIWAFASVTNDETQQVTVVTPSGN